jgi:two-component system cell cycle sensor histidine kinase/response regulator CckA
MLRRLFGTSRFGSNMRDLLERFRQPLGALGQVLFEEATDGVMIVDRSCRIVRANATLTRMLGAQTPIKPGQSAVEIFDEETRAKCAEAFREVLPAAANSAAPVHRFVGRLHRPAHTAEGVVDVDIAVAPVREAGGKTGGFILRISDITPLKRLQAQLNHSQKLQSLGQLAGGIAHDFNNLLTAIIAAADLALGRAGLDPATLSEVEEIRRNAERGSALVRQLLAFSRQQTLQPRVISVNAAIRDLSRLLHRLLGEQIRLQLELEEPGYFIRADPSQFDQVLINLAVNARDAMPEGGTLTIRSSRMIVFAPRQLGAETMPPGRYVVITVKDTGAGIPPEILPHIFDPFFTTKRDRGGSGLGLSTVHGIVRQSEGFVAVESTPGKGTSVQIYLPRCTAPKQQSPAAAAPKASLGASNQAPASSSPGPAAPPPNPKPVAQKPAPTRTVLVVDDEASVLRLACYFLRQRGYDVLAAETGEAALAVLENQSLTMKLSALVSDVVMPDMDGLSLLRRLRSVRPDLPAILVSGYAEEGLRKDVTAESVVFLPKPYSLAELGNALEKVINCVACGEL